MPLLQSGILRRQSGDIRGESICASAASLTIKQMAMVAYVVMVSILPCTVLLFHLAQQNRYNTATRTESIARFVRGTSSSAILKADLPGARKTILEY